jgi:hypothetical protein
MAFKTHAKVQTMGCSYFWCCGCNDGSRFVSSCADGDDGNSVWWMLVKQILLGNTSIHQQVIDNKK